MAVTSWLIDKSAYVHLQLGHAAAEEDWLRRIDRGLVRIATVTRLELGFSARTGDDARAGFASPPLSRMPIEYLTPAMEERAVEVQLELADRGHHRAPSIPDLIIAAIAERSGLTVLARDKDFGLIAGVTGQSVETLTLR